MWGNEPSHSQVNSHCGSWSPKWTPKFSEGDCKGETHRVKELFISLENYWSVKCLKWACMTHLDIWNTSYGQKKGRESNWQFDSRPLKVKNQPDFLACRWCATYHWKALDEGYNFIDLIAIGGLHTKLWGPKVVGVLIWGISGLPFGSPETKCHLHVTPWKGTKYNIRGKVVASPKSGLWWVLRIQVCSWLIPAPKVPKLCTNQLVI